MSAAPLPYTDPDHQLAHQFLVEEAHLLDTGRLDAWLDLLTDDVTYEMPVRVTAGRDVPEATVQTMHHFREDAYSLRLRVERLGTGHAWAEDPPSRLRHVVANVRTFATARPDEWAVESAVLVFRSRGDGAPADLLSARRVDRLRRTPGGLRLARRVVDIDESVLRTQNLAILL